VLKLPESELADDYLLYKNLWLWCVIWMAMMVSIYIKFWSKTPLPRRVRVNQFYTHKIIASIEFRIKAAGTYPLAP
jgi:hypothetical protein